MILRHTTPTVNIPSIEKRGIDPRFSKGKLVVVPSTGGAGVGSYTSQVKPNGQSLTAKPVMKLPVSPA
jgi:hypothetical protein